MICCTMELKALKKLACIHVFKNKRKYYKLLIVHIFISTVANIIFHVFNKNEQQNKNFWYNFFSISSNSTLDRVIFSKSMIDFENCMGNSNHWIRLDINVLCSVSISSGGIYALCGVHHSIMLPIA